MAHCPNCGRQNPDCSEGYTVCCNKSICLGDYSSKYGIPSNFKVGCCWSEAAKLFGGNVNVPAGSYRLS